MTDYMKIIPWVLIILGAILNYIVPILIKKGTESEDAVTNKVYITKSIGLIFVIVGCVMIFWLGGKFGV